MGGQGQMSRELFSFNERKSVICGMSLRAIMNNDDPEDSLESLSVNNPVSDEVNVELDLNEYNHSLYDMINDSVVTISTIKEFDRGKDWLSQ